MKILKIEIIEGKKLYTKWKSKMQLITTDQGIFIDNLYNENHSNGIYANGYNWKIGEEYNDGEYEINTDQKTDCLWLNIPKN